MSAKDQMSKLLDQLMGQNRDGDDKNRDKHFTDRDICRPFLLGMCINELFINTRAELGECPKVHSVTLKDEFERASAKRDYHYEEEVLEYLQGFIKDNERKIEAAKKRLDASEETPEMEAKAQEIHDLAVQVGQKVAKAESLGAEGKVDESLEAMKEVEEIKIKKKQLEDEYHAMIPRHAAQQQKLRACEVCGAFLSMYDNDRRLADHFGGKLHIGFVTIREKIKLLEEMIVKKEEKKKQEREEFKKERELEREKRQEKRSRSRSRDRKDKDDREQNRHRRDRDRDRTHDKDRDRSRERDRDQEKSRDRYRDRSRERDRDKNRHRDRSRERARDRDSDYEKDRGRDRDKDRRRDRDKDSRRSRSERDR